MILLTILLFALGLVVIIKGGDWFVDASVWLAEEKGIPKIIIGATIVSLATTLPEFFVSNIAVLRGSTDIGIGNAVGSIICNSGLILGIALVAMPNKIKRRDFAPKALLMVFSLSILFVFCLDGVVALWQGIILLILLSCFIYFNFREVKQLEKIKKRAEKEIAADVRVVEQNGQYARANIFKFIGGALGIIIGARLLVDNGVKLANIAGIPEQVIAVTLIALGTSLPELVTTITAIVKKEYSMSLGNIIGANILNVNMILGVATLISKGGLHISNQMIKGFSKPIPQTLYIDIPVALIIMAIIIIPTFIKEKTYKAQGVLMLIVYASYIAFVVYGM